MNGVYFYKAAAFVSYLDNNGVSWAGGAVTTSFIPRIMQHNFIPAFIGGN
jgi:hypothetical protein